MGIIICRLCFTGETGMDGEMLRKDGEYFIDLPPQLHLLAACLLLHVYQSLTRK